MGTFAVNAPQEEKQDKTVFDAINRLHSDMDKRFEAVDRRFEHLESSFRWIVGMYITGTIASLGVILAAFYAFASYIKV